MEMEILTEEEATAKPAGIARDDPNQYPTLEPPKYAQQIVLTHSSFRLCLIAILEKL